MTFQRLFEFETALARYTGAPYAVATDCCTHAIQACMRYCAVSETAFPCCTYLSVLQVMHRLRIEYELLDQSWKGEYKFKYTPIWDSAQRLEPNMYRSGQMQCLSFGFGKPFELGVGGAVLLDDPQAADWIALHTRDGRDLRCSPWESQGVFAVGEHHCMRLETAAAGTEKLKTFVGAVGNKVYPDLRKIRINANFVTQ